MKRLLSYDRASGTEEWFHYDVLTGETTVETINRDLSPTLDYTVARRNDDDYWRQGVKNEFAHYCHIPNSILLKWRVMGVAIDDPKELVRMVNKPEWSYLKVTDKVHLARG
jgi:hypothetical protein